MTLLSALLTSSAAAENIPPMLKASTTSVTLAATNGGQTTRITIGTKSCTIGSLLTLSTGSVGANGLDAGSLGVLQLWHVYAILNNTTSAVALVASLTGPSTGPTIPSGYGSAYRLVGAFYTNGSSVVGSVVSNALGFGDISTDWLSYSPVVSNTGGTISSQFGYFRRVGMFIELASYFDMATAGSGTSTVIWGVPSGLTVDTSIQPFAKYGTAQFYNTTYQGATFGEALMLHNLDTNGVTGTGPTTTQAFRGNLLNSAAQCRYAFSVPIVGWKPTLF